MTWIRLAGLQRHCTGYEDHRQSHSLFQRNGTFRRRLDTKASLTSDIELIFTSIRLAADNMRLVIIYLRAVLNPES